MDRPAEELLAFSGDCMGCVGASYLPIVAQRQSQAYTEQHKAWQQMRRGRYVEFNLVCPTWLRRSCLPACWQGRAAQTCVASCSSWLDVEAWHPGVRQGHHLWLEDWGTDREVRRAQWCSCRPCDTHTG